MFKRKMKVLMAIVAVLMLPLSVWAVNPPQGSVNVEDGVRIINGGYCKVIPGGRKVGLTWDSATGRWSCEGLAGLADKASATVRIYLVLKSKRICTGSEKGIEAICECSEGTMANKRCFVRADYGLNCNLACSENDLRYDAYTKTLIGSGGDRFRNGRNCNEISARLGGKGGSRRGSDRLRERLGCTQDRQLQTVMFRPGPTTANADDPDFRRICACKAR